MRIVTRVVALAFASVLLLGPAGTPARAEDVAKSSVFSAVWTKGAAWLAAQQHESGGWLDQQGKPDVGITGLAVAGLAGGPAKLRAAHQAAIDKGCAYLLARAQANGAIYDADKVPALSTYKTCIAVMGLAAADREKHKDAILKARAFLEGTQFSESYHDVKPENKDYGGWDYDEKPKKGPGTDLSNVAFALEALKEAGLPKESEVWKRAARFLDRCQNRSESNDQAAALEAKGIAVGNDGGFVYDPGASKGGEIVGPDGKKTLRSYGSMTYSGLKSFIYAGVDKKDPRVQAAYKWVQEHFTLEENPGLKSDADPKSGAQGWYYYFHTFAKALDAWGEKELTGADGAKHLWADELVAKLCGLQAADGSWQNENPRWWEDHKPLVTSYALMALDHAAPYATW